MANHHQAKLFVLYDDEQLTAGKRDPVLQTESAESSPVSYTVATSIYNTQQRRPRPTASTNTREVMCSREVLGSLRPEAPPIRLLSSEFLGLAVTGFLIGVFFALFENGFIPLFTQVLRLRDPMYPSFLFYLFEWPVCFSVFMGFLSDCRPIGGRRRKPYMIIGWAGAGLLLISIAVIDYTRVHSWKVLAEDVDVSLLTAANAEHAPIVLGLSLAARVMFQLMLVTSLSMTVEFAQRETLMDRGQLQASFYFLWFSGQAVGRFIVPSIVLPDAAGQIHGALSVGGIALVIAGVCFVPIPFIAKFLDEPYMPRAAHFSLRRRMHEFWRFCHQDVVGRILVYIVVSLFLLANFHASARASLSVFCGVDSARWQIVDAVDSIGSALYTLFWGVFLINISWHKVTVWGIIYYCAAYVILPAIIAYDVTRTYAGYVILRTIANLNTQSIKLFAASCATEVADHGREGVILGLLVGFQSMITSLGIMLSTRVEQPYTIALPQDVILDTPEVHSNIMMGSAIFCAINLVAIPVAFMLPKQKLDTQQRRAFGGFNLYACYGIALTFVGVFIASWVSNVGNLW